jgi:MtaA/CmuA family methyltransferase
VELEGVSMTSLERCLTVLNGGVPDRVPVIPQCFLFSLETAGVKMHEVVRNAAKMAEAQAVCMERYGYDGCIIDFDDATLAEACGAKVIFRDNDPAVVDENEPRIKELRDVATLKLPDPQTAARLPVWLDATRALMDRVGKHAFVMGRADQGPFTLACLLRGAQQFFIDLATGEDNAAIGDLIDYCRQVCALFGKAQKDAGAHCTSIGDSYASPNLISPRMYRQYALQPEIDLVNEVQAYGIPMSIHICGNTTGILPDMAKTGARLLEVDWKVDMGAARKIVPPATTLMGNVNPSDPMVLGEPGQVREAVRTIIAATGGRGLILSSGCALGRNTKPENMEALVAAAVEFGTFPNRG